jgi:hypothetical protein
MPRNPQGIYNLPAGNPVVSGTLIESTWANPTMSDIAAALTGSLPRDGSAGMQAQLLLVDQTANPPNNGQMAISVDYLTNVLENYQSGAQGGAGNPIIFENDRMAVVDYTITNGKNGMTAGPFAIGGGVTIGVPAGSRWSIVGGGTTDGPPVALGDTFPLMDGTSAPGTGTFASRNDHVHPSDTSRAPINSPALTGIPTAPTASLGNNSTQIATTAFVIANAGSGGGGTPSDDLPLMDGVASAGVAIEYSRGDHIHPSPTGFAPINSPVFTGNPQAPTPLAGDNDTTIATTAFVANAVSAAGGLLPSNNNPLMNGTASAGTGTSASRDDHVHPSDTSRAPLASPTFTGVPAAPTASTASNTTQIATTQFVQNVVAGIGSNFLTKTNNLSDLSNAATARGNLGLASKSQFNTACTDGSFAFLNSENVFANKQQFNAGLVEKYSAVAVSTIDCSLASVFSRTISGATSLLVSNVAPAGNVSSFILELTNGGSATVTWWAGIKWSNGAAPTLTAAGTDILGFYTRDGGVTWRGTMMSKDSK